MTSKLGHFKKQAKALIARRGAQAEMEKTLFLAKLQRLSLISGDGTVDDVLSLVAKDIFERRLQTLVYRKGFAHSPLQARQFIVHGHIFIKGQKMNVPSYLVPAGDENVITFDPKSALADPEHPERVIKEKAPKMDDKVKKKVAEEPEEVIVLEEEEIKA
jgi:small subunit ribosomal protein S4